MIIYVILIVNIVALISFIINLVINISPFTGLIRSMIVYIGVLFVFFMAGILMKWGIATVNEKWAKYMPEVAM